MATKKEMLEKSQKAIGDFFKLAKFLFSDDAPYDVNEIPVDNPCYEGIKAISDEMGLDWDNMTHDESNRVMLNILGDAFLNIQPEKDYEVTLSISFKKKE